MSGIDPRSPEMNYVVVRGIRSPGRAQLTEVATPYNWHVQEAYGLSGGSTTFRGRGIAKFTLTISLWTPDQFQDWAAFKKAIQPPTPTSPFVVDMGHPLLASAGITAVCIESLGEPMRQPGGGLWLSTIKIIEYRPPQPAVVKPDKSIPAVEKAKVESPKTEADRALDQAKKGLSDAMTDGRTTRKPPAPPGAG